jgi:hypothetical protein
MKHHNTFPVLIPTNNPMQGRWIIYKLRSLYPGERGCHGDMNTKTCPTIVCPTDELAQREMLVASGYRIPPRELKRRIRRRLGVRALRIAR